MKQRYGVWAYGGLCFCWELDPDSLKEKLWLHEEGFKAGRARIVLVVVE